MTDILTDAKSDRSSIVPVKYPKLFAMGKDLFKLFWDVENGTDFSQDKIDYERMPEINRDLIRLPLAFFSQADMLILDNINCNIQNVVTVPEVKMFYAHKASNEAVHNLAYGLQIAGIFNDVEQKKLSDGIRNFPIITKMSDFAAKYFEPSNSMATRMLASICIESLFFEPAFAVIAGLSSNKLFPQVDKFNQWISRDEGLHVKFDVAVYNTLINRLQVTDMKKIIQHASEISQEFADAILLNPYKNMNSTDYKGHIRYKTNMLCRDLEIEFIYSEIKTPLIFMTSYSSGTPSSDFFTNTNTKYSIVDTTKELVTVSDF